MVGRVLAKDEVGVRFSLSAQSQVEKVKDLSVVDEKTL